MATLTPTLEDHDYQNWVKGGLALKYARDGIEKFVEKNTDDFLQDVLSSLPAGANSCSSCTTENTVQCMNRNNYCKIVNGKCKVHNPSIPEKKSKRKCPISVCNQIYTAVLNEHRFKCPTWNNTDSQLWCSETWQVAKCFMPQGYESTRSASETDFPGLLSVVINDERFAKQVSVSLSAKRNIFIQAREVRNSILHKANMKLTDQELKGYINVLDTMLSDTKFLATHSDAINAKAMLDKLLKGQINITADDERELRALSAMELKILANFESATKLKQKEVLDNIESAKTQAREDMTAAVTETKETIKIERKKAVAAIQNAPRCSSEQTKTEDIRWELISLYRDEEHLSTPLFPLTPLEKVNIEAMYVKPNVECKHEAIEDYKGIFKDKRKKIYVVGDAGLGKTALCQKMVSTWCQVHSETVETMSDDKQAMAQFDFLFYVSLRDANTQDFNDTNVVDMIKHQMCDLSEQFHEQLPSVLKNEKCLIILDGLDEWTLERKTASQVNKGIPGRQAIRNCTVLTTTRPWKLEAIQLASDQIDAKIEILGISQPSSKQLIETMIRHLNETNNSNIQMEDFESELNASNLNPFRTIPVVLKQLVCLWHAGKPLGHTKCAIYSQMVEFLLELSQTRLNQDPKYLKGKNKWTNSQIPLPSCFNGNATKICQEFKPVLVGLGRVAFKTLLNENQEASLVFPRSDVETHGMKEEDVNICLSIGILSQSGIVKDTRSHRKLSFLHKTYQEFLAAVYLSRLTDQPDEHADCVQTIKQTCNSKARCLEMKNIIAFISGVSSTTTTTCELIAHITPLVNTDPDSIYWNPRGLHEYLIYCLLEGWRCSHNNKHLLCKTITIGKNCEHMDLLCEANIHQTKILLIRSPPTARCLEHLLQMDTLEKLYIGDPISMNPQVISENNVYTVIQNNTDTLTQVDIQSTTFRSRTQLSLLLHNLPLLSEFSILGTKLSQHQLDSLQSFEAQRPKIKVKFYGHVTILPDAECTD